MSIESIFVFTTFAWTAAALRFDPGNNERLNEMQQFIFTKRPIAPSMKWRREMQEIVQGPDLPVNDQKSFVTHLFNCSCSHVEGGCAKGNGTIVTSILSINKPGRKFEDYVTHLRSLISRLPHTPIVAFVERGFEEQVIGAHPKGNLARTLCVVGLTAKELPQYSFLKEYAKAFLNMANQGTILVPEMTLPVYDVVQHSKVDMVERVALQNPFHSESFAWLDGGLHPPMNFLLPHDGDIDILQCGDRVCVGFNRDFHTINNAKREEFVQNKTKVAHDCNNCGNGATWTGSRNAVLKFSKAYRYMIDQYLREGVMDDDQGPLLQLLLIKDDAIQDCRCKGYEFCTGFMLGHHKGDRARHFQWA